MYICGSVSLSALWETGPGFANPIAGCYHLNDCVFRVGRAVPLEGGKLSIEREREACRVWLSVAGSKLGLEVQLNHLLLLHHMGKIPELSSHIVQHHQGPGKPSVDS